MYTNVNSELACFVHLESNSDFAALVLIFQHLIFAQDVSLRESGVHQRAAIVLKDKILLQKRLWPLQFCNQVEHFSGVRIETKRITESLAKKKGPIAIASSRPNKWWALKHPLTAKDHPPLPKPVPSLSDQLALHTVCSFMHSLW